MRRKKPVISVNPDPPEEIKRPQTPPPPPQEKKEPPKPLATCFPFETVQIPDLPDEPRSLTRSLMLQSILDHLLRKTCPNQPEEFYAIRKEVCLDIYIRLMVLACRQVDTVHPNEEEGQQSYEAKQERLAIVKLLFLLAGVNFSDWYKKECDRAGKVEGASGKVYTKWFVDDLIRRHHTWG